jgi:hypothetical protein
MNKLNNQGYFSSRLKNSGYQISRLEINYSKTDPRLWSIVINPGEASVLCTCYVNANKNNLKDSVLGDNYFELYDGGQFLPQKMKLNTSSIEVIVNFLVEHGVVGRDFQKR